MAPSASPFLVGLPYPHHARHSGYCGFAPHVGERLVAPVGVRRFPGPPGSWADAGLARLLGQPRYSVPILLSELAAAAHMRRNEPGLYHVLHGERDLLLLRRLPVRRRHRLIATFHGPPLDRPAPRVERVARALDAAVVLSEWQREHYARLMSPDRLFVVPHGVDTAFFTPPLRSPETPVVLSVGTHGRDIEALGAAAREIWAARPDTRVRVIGLEHPGRLGREVLADPRLELREGISDGALREAYRTASVALLPFAASSASNALLEAMASGLPVVSTEVGGVREYTGARAATLCAPGDAAALAEATLALLEDPRAAARQGHAAREAALAFDFRRVAERLREVYRAVAAA